VPKTHDIGYRYPDAQKKPLEKQAVVVAIQQAELAHNEILKRIV